MSYEINKEAVHKSFNMVEAADTMLSIERVKYSSEDFAKLMESISVKNSRRGNENKTK